MLRLWLLLVAVALTACAPKAKAKVDRRLARELVTLESRAEKLPASRPLATARMKEIVESHGWPSAALAGEAGSRAAFLLVIKSHDAALVSRAASLAERKETPERYAQLVDRGRILSGKRQLYGTQLKKALDGTIAPFPIEDEANLAKRRAAIGLPP